MNAAPDAPFGSVDDQLHRLRTLVYEQDETAANVDAELRAQIELYALRAQLLDQLLKWPASTAADLARLAADLEEWATHDMDVALDICAALLMASAESPLLQRVLGILHDSTVADDMSTLSVLSFLLTSGHAAQAVRLLRALVPVTVNRPRRSRGDEVSLAPASVVTGPAAGLLSGVVTLSYQLLDHAPEDDETRRALTWCLLELGRLEEALPHVETLLPRHPQDEELTWYRVAALEGLDRPEEALATLDTLPQAALDDPVLISYRLQLMLNSGSTSQALELARSATYEHQDDIGLTLIYIEALERIGNDDEALAVARDALTRHPDSVGLAVATGSLLVDAYRFSEAIPLLQDAVSSADRRSDATRPLAAALLATDRTSEALEYLDTALTASPQDGALLVQRAMALQVLGRPVEALDAVDAAERTGVGEPTLWVLRGDLLLALGRESEAIPQYKRALAEGSDDLTVGLVQKLENSAYEMVRDRPGDALNLLAAARDAGKLSPYGRGLYAELLRLTDQFELAVAEADMAAQEGADVGMVSGTKGQALVDLYRSSEALDVLDGTGNADSEPRFSVSVRIDALLNLDRPSAAERLLKQHFPVSDKPEPNEAPDDWLNWSVSTWGRILMDLGQFEEAGARMRRYTRSYGHQTAWDYWTAVSYNRCARYDRALPLLSRNVDEWGDSAPWVWNELGDALVASSGRLSQQARDAYESATRTRFTGPGALVAEAWARFRLGDIAGATETYRRALNSAIDPFREHRLRLVLVRHAAGDHTAAAKMLSEVLRDVVTLPDPQRIVGILGEGIYVVNLIGDDPEYGPPSAQVWRELREELEASKTGLPTAR